MISLLAGEVDKSNSESKFSKKFNYENTQSSDVNTARRDFDVNNSRVADQTQTSW